MVRVEGYHDRGGIQQALDLGADGVLVPYINTAEEARQAVSCRRYPTAGTRSVYFPQRSMNKGGLLGYAGAANKNNIVALQVETASCIQNIDGDCSGAGRRHPVSRAERSVHVDGALREVRIPAHVHVAGTARPRLRSWCERRSKNNVILGLFLFGTVAGGRVSGEGVHVHQHRQ